MVNKKTEPLFIVMIDDDEEDIYSMKRALEMNESSPRFKAFPSGGDFFGFLRDITAADRQAADLPDLILLDLNLPKVDGFEILSRLKMPPHPCPTPVIVFSTSESEVDCLRSYRLGASAFFTKPASFQNTRKVSEAICMFWQTPHIKRAFVTSWTSLEG